MRARYHGEPITSLEARQLAMARAAAGAPGRPTFDFMFGSLATNPANRLPEGPETIEALKALGSAMAEDPSNENSSIPAAYTYFGQFIDHDITKTEFDRSIQAPNGQDLIQMEMFLPLSRADVISRVHNVRTATLDLDSVYEGDALKATAPDGRMIIGKLSSVPPGSTPSIVTADRFHDLPRLPMIVNPQTVEEEEADRKALIGDPRNDENLLVAQMHVAFLRSHNALMDRGMSAQEARTALRRRYQWAVLHDFLRQVCQKDVIDDVLSNGPRFWNVEHEDGLFMPLEFAGAAYRFGHSMVRGNYSHNSTFTNAPFNLFFTFTALSGDLSPGAGPNFQFDTLPDNWVIEWHRFFGTSANPASLNPARRIDANLTPELGNLRDFQGIPLTDLMAKLATRNLLRGYLLGLPTGQAVANHMGITPLSRESLRKATPSGLSNIIEKAGLLDRTPLWFYILAEAGDPDGPDGQTLGPVGSRIVAETLWNLVKHSEDSVIKTPPTDTELDGGEYSLRGIIRIGQDKALPQI